MKILNIFCFLFFTSISPLLALTENSVIPSFEAKTHDGKVFDSSSRKGKWTVLYFYPKASTPGCTKQACSFRDSLKIITDLGAEVFGISIDQVADQKKFHQKNKLNFTLLADHDGKIAEAFGVKSPHAGIAKRWTFILDPDLKVRWIGRDVDPSLDAQNVAEQLRFLAQPKK